MIFTRHGEIANAGDSEIWRFELDPFRVYLVDIVGEAGLPGDIAPGTYTLTDPHLYGVWNDERTHIKTGGHTRALTLRVERANGPSGVHHFEVRSFGDNTGTYRLRVRINDLCYERDGQAHYSHAGGPGGYNDEFDRAGDSSTTAFLRPHPHENVHLSTMGYLGDNREWYWDHAPDEDWYRIEGVDEDFEYTIEVWTSADTPGKYQATQLKILGIYDKDGNEFVGPSSTGGSVSVTFRPNSDDMYYVSVGSEGSDRTGVYYMRIFEQEMSGSPREGRSIPQEGQGKSQDKAGKSNEPPEEKDTDSQPTEKNDGGNEPPEEKDTDSQPTEKNDGGNEPPEEKDTDSEEPPARNSPAGGAPPSPGRHGPEKP